MPAIVTCKGTLLEKSWNVAADDLVLPAFVAVVVGLFNVSLISAVIVAFFFIPSSSELSISPCQNLSYPPLLYAPLFSLDFIEVVFIFCEGMLIVFGARGAILHNTPGSLQREKIMPILLQIRGFVGFLELAAIVAALVGVFHPSVLSLQDECEELIPRLRLAQVVVIIQVVLFALFLIKVCIYTDPLGISTPGLLEKLKMLDDTDSRGSWIEVSGDHTPGTSASIFQLPQDEPFTLASEVNVWTQKRKSVFRLDENDIARATQVHNDKVSRRNYERRLRAIFCCLGVKGHKSRGAALEDVARGLYTVFSETDVVLSDIIAGFALLKNHQRKVMKKGGEIALTRKFRMVTFKMMPLRQRYGYAPNVIRENHSFDLSTVDNQQLLLDLIHYMHYAMGIYGWPLHVFDNLACGFCQLCSVSCCKFRCTHKRVKEGDFLSENLCMCGVGTFRLQTGVKEEDILYVNYENKIFLAPFIVCLDHKMKAVVVCVRGTLSFKDTLTDMSFSPIHKKVEGVKETYIHGGMYRAAIGIQNTLRRKQLLAQAFKKHKGYQLVVTGHSLGAGVASILALLLKQELKYSDDLIRCFAFSPPGALFSFPLAEYTKSFITTVVLGNDIVPRITLRGLLFLKLSIEEQLKKTNLPKYRILFCKKRRRCSHLFSCCYRRKRKEDEEDPLTPTTTQEKYRQTGDHFASAHPNGIEGGVDSVDSSEATGVEPDRSGESIEVEEDCLEWKVLNSGTTTASIRKKLFQRSISVHPDGFVEPDSGYFSRPRYSVNYRTQKSVATESFAKKMKKAVSFDFDIIPEGAIKGADEVDLPDSVQPAQEETSFYIPEQPEVSQNIEESLELTLAHPKDQVVTAQAEIEYSSMSNESAAAQEQTSSSPENITSRPATDTDSEPVASHHTADSSSLPASAAIFQGEGDSDENIKPSEDPEASITKQGKSRLKSLALSKTSLTLNLGNSQSMSSGNSSIDSRTAQVDYVKMASNSNGKVGGGLENLTEEEIELRLRRGSDATPGSLLQNAVPKLLEHCRADEGKLFMPFFMPGRVLHLQVKKSKNWCGKDRLEMDEVFQENLCVILVGDGMVDDHLPNNVLSALKAFKSECGVNFYHEEINQRREQQKRLRSGIRNVPETSRVNETDGFIFVNPAGSPLSDDGSAVSAETARRRLTLKKQRSFDKSTDTHPPLAGRNSRLNIVERSSAGLGRISECADEGSPPSAIISGVEDSKVRSNCNSGSTLNLPGGASSASDDLSDPCGVGIDYVDGPPNGSSLAGDSTTGGVAAGDPATGGVAAGDCAVVGIAAGGSTTAGVVASDSAGMVSVPSTEGVAGEGVAGVSSTEGVAGDVNSKAIPLLQRRGQRPGGLKLHLSGDSTTL